MTLPPERPPWQSESSESTSPVSAVSATCSGKSEPGDPPSVTVSPGILRSPTASDVSTSELSAEPDAPATLPGVADYVEQLAEAAPTLFRAPTGSSKYPAKAKGPVIPMTPKGLEIAARVKEMFHQYSNRQDRSQQATMGPSEIGSPCDRRIAMSLLRLPPVNPGGDGWAAFIGTCTHVGLAEMFMWADAGSGRYSTEERLTFPSEHVPGGTTDLIDRQLWYVGDHKVMGTYSLDKLKTEGPSEGYRVQGHTYGMGARLRGYPIEDVVIIGWPRERSSLDALYVWTEPYNPDLAREAIDRVDRIAATVDDSPAILYGEAETDELEAKELTAYRFPIDNSDCNYCPWFVKGAPRSEGGLCNGRK